jgi:hypothetical protein
LEREANARDEAHHEDERPSHRRPHRHRTDAMRAELLRGVYQRLFAPIPSERAEAPEGR